MTSPADRESSEPSDEALVEDARGGSVRAFELLLDRHQSRVLRLLRLLGVRPDDREDVAQEVFIRVFRHLDGFRPGHLFRSWLYRICVNAAHDHRSRTGRRALREEAWSAAADQTPAVGANPARAAEDRDLARRIEGALSDLTERERAVFVLREFEGLDSAAVARALGVSSITVRRHLGLARRRIRRALSEA